MARELQQQGVKWWKQCPRCGWAGKPRAADTNVTACPNCGYQKLDVLTDFHVYNGRRYDQVVRNPKEKAEADAARKKAGQPALVPMDRINASKPGHEWKDGKPVPVKKP